MDGAAEHIDKGPFMKSVFTILFIAFCTSLCAQKYQAGMIGSAGLALNTRSINPVQHGLALCGGLFFRVKINESLGVRSELQFDRKALGQRVVFTDPFGIVIGEARVRES